jgi:hypothetical protein
MPGVKLIIIPSVATIDRAMDIVVPPTPSPSIPHTIIYHIKNTMAMVVKEIVPMVGVDSKIPANGTNINISNNSISPTMGISPLEIRYHYTMPHSYPYLSHLSIGHIIAYRCER